MRRIFVVLTVTATALGACTADRDAPAPEPTTAAAQCDSMLHQAFSAWERAGFSGAVAISTGGRFDCLAGYGYADEATGTRNTADTVFDIGSVTKAFTAAAIVSLVEDGTLSLADRAGDHLPELSGPVADATVTQLLHHTSGLSGTFGADYEPLGADEAIAAIDELDVTFTPGTDHVYSNAGYTLLALIIERVSGTSYRDHLRSNLLPLPDGEVAGGFWNGEPAAPGPRAVGYLDGGGIGEPGDFPGPHWALDGNGGLAMTVGDLAAWTHALFTGQVVSPASVALITSPGFDLGEGRSEAPGWVAFDESVYGLPFLATAGGGGEVGHNVVVAWLPEGERVVVMASNRPEPTAEQVLDAVGPALLAGDPLPTPAVPSGQADPAAIVGTYQLNPGEWFDVAVSDNRLLITATGAAAVAALFPPRHGPDDQREHEARVRSLLAGETREGQEERAALESAFGPIRDVALAGTITRGGEARTYVTITTDTGTVTGWYAVDQAGGIEAAEVPTGPPAMPLVPAGDDRYRPDDPTGSGPDVMVEFADGHMTITGPGGVAVARRDG